MAADALPTDDEIRRTAAEILARPDFQPNVLPGDGSLVKAVLQKLLEWMLIPFQWIHGLSEGLPDAIRWLMTIGLSLTLLLILGHMIYTLARGGRSAPPTAGRRREREAPAPPEDLERLADEAASQENFMEGVRLLFRATILRLEQIDKRPLRPGTTNRELLRRYRSTPLHNVLSRFVETMDEKWYGGRPCTHVDFADCRQAHESVMKLFHRDPKFSPDDSTRGTGEVTKFR